MFTRIACCNMQQLQVCLRLVFCQHKHNVIFCPSRHSIACDMHLLATLQVEIEAAAKSTYSCVAHKLHMVGADPHLLLTIRCAGRGSLA